MMKDKLFFVRDFLVKNSKIAFPILLTAAVAVTVALALSASGSRKVDDIAPSPASVDDEALQTGAPEGDVVEEVPLLLNEDAAVRTLITDYYNAQAAGDLEVLKSLCDVISEKDLLLYQETARYIDSYPVLEIYTKPGYAEGDTIAYVYFKLVFMSHEEQFPGFQTFYIRTSEDGSRYIMRSDVSGELDEYAKRVSEQDDVIEFMNRIVAEYDQFKEEHPDMAGYPEEVTAHVGVAVGEILASQKAQDEGGENPGTEEDQNGQGEVPFVQEGPKYATATTTVNVRSSDSEKADKVGKVSGGSKVQVLEEGVNGWSRVSFEGKEGYIKSQYLQMQESAEGLQSVGNVTATTNVNVRSAASQTAEKLGVLAGGDSVELIAVEGEWGKIKYNGQVGYVKLEFVRQ